MQKIKIRLPATLTHFGPSLDTFALAIGLHTHIEMSSRYDNQLIVETEGDGAGHYPLAIRHPVVRGASRYFQHIEDTQLGLHIKVKNDIPIGCGLGAENAFQVAGVIGANYLMGNRHNREQLIALAVQFVDHRDSAIATFVGGLITSLYVDDQLAYQALPITPFRMVIAVPKLRKFQVDQSPDLVSSADMRANIRRTTLMQHALANGDIDLLGNVLDDPIDQPLIRHAIPDFSHVAEIAKQAGAIAVTTTGRGQAMIFFCKHDLPDLEQAIIRAFDNLNTDAQVMTVPIDTQGVVISIMQSA